MVCRSQSILSSSVYPLAIPVALSTNEKKYSPMVDLDSFHQMRRVVGIFKLIEEKKNAGSH